MPKKMLCRIQSSKNNGTEFYEGVVTIENAMPTKLTKVGTTNTKFVNRSGLVSSVKSFAKRHNYDTVALVDYPTKSTTTFVPAS